MGGAENSAAPASAPAARRVRRSNTVDVTIVFNDDVADSIVEDAAETIAAAADVEVEVVIDGQTYTGTFVASSILATGGDDAEDEEDNGLIMTSSASLHH